MIKNKNSNVFHKILSFILPNKVYGYASLSGTKYTIIDRIPNTRYTISSGVKFTIKLAEYNLS